MTLIVGGQNQIVQNYEVTSVKPSEGLLKRHFKLLFSKDYDPSHSKTIEKSVYSLFKAVQLETVGKVKELVAKLKTESGLNACAILGRARLIAQQCEHDGTAPAERNQFQEKKVFLISTLKGLLETAKIDEKTFFRDLYTGRLKYHTASKAAKVTTGFSGKPAKLLLLIGLVALAVRGVDADCAAKGLTASSAGPLYTPAVSHFHFPDQFCIHPAVEENMAGTVQSMDESLSKWNDELDSQIVDRTFTHYTRVVAQLPTYIPRQHNGRPNRRFVLQERVYRDLSRIQVRLDKTFSKFKMKAGQELARLKDTWPPIRDQLVEKMSDESGNVRAEVFVDGIKFLDTLSAVHEDYEDSVVSLRMQQRDLKVPHHGAMQVWKKLNASMHNHIEVIEKFAHDSVPSLNGTATEPLKTEAAKEWLTRSIDYRPNDNRFINNAHITRLMLMSGYPHGEFIEGGQTAMTLAATIGAISALQALIGLGVHPDFSLNSYGQGSFYLALLNKQYKAARLLGLGGGGFHPVILDVPAVNKDVRAIKVMGKYDFDSNMMWDNLNSLHRAAIFGHDRSINTLLDMGADPNGVDHRVNHTALCWYRAENITKKPPERLVKSDVICDQIMAAKLVGHVLEIDASITINGHKLALTASWPSVMLKNMMDIFAQFTKSYSNEFSAEEVRATRHFLRSGYSFKGNNFFKLVDDLKEGKPVVIPTGFFVDENGAKSHHETLTFFYKNKLVLANKGYGTRQPVEMFEIDPTRVTADDLRYIWDMTNKTFKDYADWRKNIPQKFQTQAIGPKYHRLQNRVQKVKPKPLNLVNYNYPYRKYQPVGNCAWESNETGLYAFLSLMRNDITARRSFHRWMQYAEFYAASNFFQKVSVQTIVQNPSLISTILERSRKNKEQNACEPPTYRPLIAVSRRSPEICGSVLLNVTTTK